MPEPRFSAATKHGDTQRPDNDHKSSRDYPTCPSRTEREEKDEEHAGSASHQDAGKRGGTLSSLPSDQIRSSTTNRHNVPAISSIPSPSSDLGKLVPLDLGRRSCTPGSTPRLSLRSTSPRALRKSQPEKITSSSGPDGSNGPRNVSPRLPAMKSPPSPRKDESIPSMPSIAGPHATRRVRSLSPKRMSAIDRMEPIHPENIKTRTAGGGQFSPLPDAKDGESRILFGDTGGEGKCGPEVIAGRHGRIRESQQREGDFAEAKSEAKDARAVRPGSCSPLRSPGGTAEGSRRAHRLEVDEPAAEMTRSSRKSHQEPSSGGRLASLGDSYGRGDKSEGSAANSSIPRGEEGATSPRTRRMRPERGSGM